MSVHYFYSCLLQMGGVTKNYTFNAYPLGFHWGGGTDFVGVPSGTDVAALLFSSTFVGVTVSASPRLQFPYFSDD